MKKATEQRIIVKTIGEEKVVRKNIIDENMEVQIFERIFPVVRASQLSLKDRFLKHNPESYNQRMYKDMIIKAIKSGLTDFRAPIIDPSFNAEGHICYKTGGELAGGKSAIWWEEELKNFMPNKNSRMGTDIQRYAWIGLLIKKLIEEEKYTVSKAWEAVCDNSRKLLHYFDFDNTECEIECTESKKISKWYDLSTSSKITKRDYANFLLFGGYVEAFEKIYILKNILQINDKNRVYDFAIGWLVLDV